MQTDEQEFFRVRLEELGDLKKLRMAPPIKYQSQPYLSIVAASRNDNHGGDLLNRMQYFIDSLLKQTEKFDLPTELVLVEWNPPINRPSLSDVLRWGTQNEYCTIRIIEVPPKTHRRYQHSAKLPLYQMIAKNVGIRRARGNFVLATNIDILFPDELFSFLASDRLTEGKIYRANRLDVKEDPAGRLSIDELLSFCKQHIIRVNDKYGSHNLITGDYHRIYPHGCDNSPDYLTTIGGIALNTNACGDFQLMARRHWTELQGYPELDMFSFHLDSVFEYMAHFKGIVEETLPDQMGIFHLEHTEGWTPEIHRNKTMDTKLEKENIPRLSSQQFYSLRVQMADGKGSGIFNGDNWGLGSDSLKEKVVKHAKWERNCHSEKGFLSKPAEQEQEIRLLNAHSIDKYLSIVVTARNDNHGGNMLHRMQTFVDGLYSQCKTYDVDAELIIVEWNPPRNRKRISEVIEWQKVSTPLTVRIIEVSPEMHCRIGNSDKIPLFQMIAKNVGIQRARGKFILATCIDILFSDELMWFLSKKQLDEDCFYRICRYDVGSKVIPVDDSIQQRLEFCWQNAIRFQGLNGTENIGENANKISHIWKGRDFFKLSEKEIIALLKKESEGKKLFTNACGDFTMMARDKWFSLRGHPELPKWSIYLDGVFLHMAYVSGLRQIILPDPMKIYHIEHDMGWAVTQAPINERPSLDYQKEYLPWCNKMLKEKRPLNPNNENWGMAKENLKELTIESKGKETRNGAMRVSAPTGIFSEKPNKVPGKFQEWIDQLGTAQNQLYYRDQTPSSLGYLFEIAKCYKPTKIIEIGTLSGLSLRTWSLTDSAAEIIAIDLSFDALRQSQQITPVDLSRVKLLEQDILKTDFNQLWGPNDRVLLYVDAHDMPNVPIMDYILKTAVPALTPESMVVVDDLWHSPACLNGKSARQFFESTVIKEIDPLQCFQGYYAPYWKGGSFFGFREVIPLLEWVNSYKIDLVFEPGIKSVTFEWKQPRSADSSMDSREFARLCGKIKYNPVDNMQNTEEVPTQADQQALALCNKGAKLYAAFQMDLAMACFQRASALSASVSGILYAQGVILARAGKFGRALKVLEKDVANPAPHSNARILLEDIQAWINKGISSRVRGKRPMASKPITIFAIPKDFKGHTDIIQRNAIKSWTLLQPRPEIILFGDDKGTPEIAQEFGLRHVPDVKHNEYGTPLVNDLFAQAEGMATNNILAYINADIILMSDFMPVVNIARTQFAEFLMIGQRWDIDCQAPLNLEASAWEKYLHKKVSRSGSLHIPRGLDYFVFSKHLWKKIPAFAIGRTAWDNWLAYQPIIDQHPVVDATGAVVAIHQNHDYSHFAANRDEVWKGEEARHNQYLAGEQVCKGSGSAFDATWHFTQCGLKKRPQPQYAAQHSVLFSKLEEKNWNHKYLSYQSCFESVSYLNRVQSPSISIVVISWRLNQDTLMNFKILQKQRDQNFELIFVDNGAEAKEFEALKPFVDTYIRLNTNTGAYLARNIGALFANAPILFFLEDDGIPTHDIIKVHLQAFRKYDIISCRGVISPKTDNLLNKIATHYYLGDKEYPIFADIEGNTTYRADIFYAAGGWDDNIQYGGGGIELSIRLSKIETDLRKQIYSPAPVIYHDYATDDDHLKAKTEKQKKSRLYLKEKHPEWDHFISHYETYKNVNPLLKIKRTSPSQDPKITVCIPTFNRSKYLSGAIKSALDQTYKNFKILIVDDGSEDNTEQVVRSFNDSRIRYVRNDENQGRPVTRNRAVKEADTDYVLWLDDDDLLKNNIIETYMSLLVEDPTIDIFYCNLQLFDSDTGENLALFEAKDWSFSSAGLLESLVNGVGITNLGSLIRKSLYWKTGFYNESFLRAQDYEFWSRAAGIAKFFKVNEVLCKCRKHSGNISLGPNVDYTYDSIVIRNIVNKYPLKKIFTKLDWSSPQKAKNAALYNVGKNLMRVNDYYNAEMFLSTISEDFLCNNSVIDLIRCNLLMGKMEKCEDIIRRLETTEIIKHNVLFKLQDTVNEYHDVTNKLGKYLKSKQYDKADKILNGILEKFGPSYIAEIMIAKCLEIAKKREEALEHYKLALKIRPEPNLLEKTINLSFSDTITDTIKEMYERTICEIPMLQKIINVEDVNLVSVIIPTYNRPEMLANAILSVIKQSYENFEIIVVNDAGVNVENIIQNFNITGNVKYIEHEENRGMAAARNTGIKIARGKYIALLDDDDLFYPNHLKVAMAQLGDDTPVIYTDAARATYRQINGLYHLIGKKVPYSIDFDKEKLLIGNISPINCFVFEKEKALQAGLFDETFTALEDWEFFIRLSEQCNFKHIAKVTAQINWRIDGTTVTSSRGAEFKKNRERIYKRYRNKISKIPDIHAIEKIFHEIWREDNNPGGPLVSIVILAYNQLEYTKKCITSIVENTNVFFELILVDNGSTDGTAEYLESELTSLISADMLRINRNDSNLGYARGNNQGMAIAKGDYILLLNNDVVVTPGWLNRLIECAEKSPDIGIVGPMSNFVVGPQLVEAVPYDLVSLEGLNKFAEKRGIEYAGQAKRLARVVGFCMLLKRDVLEKIGGLDTRYGLGNFEDDDFSLRAVLAGYGSCIAKDCFIHHFGNRTFVGANINYHESLENNWKLFKEKWELPEELPYGSYFSIPNLLKGGFIPEKHFCSLGQANSLETDPVDSFRKLSDGGSIEGQYEKAQQLVRAGKYVEAVRRLEGLLEMNPDFAIAHNDLGVLYYKQGVQEKALNHYEQAVQLEPHNLNFQKNLADLYFVESGRVQDALAIYYKVLEIDPGDAEALMSMGLICGALERPEDARHFYNRVLENEPWNVDARQRLENL